MFCSSYNGIWALPDGSDGKESACSAGDLGSIPGLGRSPGEGNGYPHQWGFPSGSAVKNLPAMQETWVRSLNWEDPLEKGMATHTPVFLFGESPRTEEPGGLQSMEKQSVGHKEMSD